MCVSKVKLVVFIMCYLGVDLFALAAGPGPGPAPTTGASVPFVSPFMHIAIVAIIILIILRRK